MHAAPRFLSTLLVSAALASILSLAACDGSESPNETPGPEPVTQTPGPSPLCPQPEATLAPLSDAQVMRVLIVANEGEIRQGQVAQAKGTTEEVRAYGQHMVEEHTAANARLTALASQLGVTPEESPLSEQLTAEATQVVAVLNSLPAERFDLSYLDSQIAQHSKLAFLGDSLLLPSAQAEALRGELTTLRATTQEHLVDAVTRQSELVP